MCCLIPNMTMKQSIKSISLVAILSLGILTGCGDDPAAPTPNGEVSISTSLTKSTVSSAYTKGGSITAGPTCDSVVISRVRFVFSDLKLHISSDDSASSDDKGMIKTGPVLMEYLPGSSVSSASASIPTGTYSRIKYEIHKLDDSKSSDTAAFNDPAYADFVTGGRYTYIIEGLIWNSNSAVAFTFKSSKNENLNLDLDTPVTVVENTVAPITLAFDPTGLFKHGAKPLDPRYEENRNDIEKMVKDAFKALKK